MILSHYRYRADNFGVIYSKWCIGYDDPNDYSKRYCDHLPTFQKVSIVKKKHILLELFPIDVEY